MTEHEELKAEVLQIIRNARAARFAGLITREQEREVVRIPRRDLAISALEHGLDDLEELRHVTETLRQS